MYLPDNLRNFLKFSELFLYSDKFPEGFKIYLKFLAFPITNSSELLEGKNLFKCYGTAMECSGLSQNTRSIFESETLRQILEFEIDGTVLKFLLKFPQFLC